MKLLICTFLFFIVAHLGIALRCLIFDEGKHSDRVVKALTWRVTLSLALFFVLVVGHYSGWISDHPLNQLA